MPQNINVDSSPIATIFSTMRPITNSLSSVQSDIPAILQREQDRVVALLSLSPLLSTLFVSYANRATALEAAATTPCLNSEERKTLQDAVTALRGENERLKSENFELAGKLEAVVASQEAFRSQVSSLKEINRTQQDNIKSLRAKLTEAKDSGDNITALPTSSHFAPIMPPKAAPKAAEDGEPMEAQVPRRSNRILSRRKPAEELVKPARKPTAQRKKLKLAESAEGSSSVDLAVIDIGDTLPSYTLKTEKNEDVDVATLAAEKGLILFLVPKSDTPGCTTQACGFRDFYPEFTSLNYEVYCISADSPAAQTKWQTKKNLPYALLSDPKRVLIKALTGSGAKTARSHFIFGGDGKLVEKKVPVKPADSPKLALEFIKGLNKDTDAMTVEVRSNAEAAPAEDTPAGTEEGKEA